VPRSRFIRALQVERGFDIADTEIAQRLAPGDDRKPDALGGERERDAAADAGGGAGHQSGLASDS